MHCKICDQTYSSECSWRQGRCPHVPPLINLEKLKMNIQPKDTSQGHFRVSMAKSALRIVAGVFLMYGFLVAAGAILIAAEMLGIVEELV